MSEFDPAQLDKLEDALEALDDPRALEEIIAQYDLDDATADRFAAYREIGDLVSMHFDEEAAPAAAFERAMAAVEAEATGVVAPLDVANPDGASVQGSWIRWWRRWRSRAIPLAALAGTTAVVLWIVRPDDGAPDRHGIDTTFTEAPAKPAPKAAPPLAEEEIPEQQAADRNEGDAPSEAEPQRAAPMPLPEQKAKQTSDDEKNTPRPTAASRSVKEENVMGPAGYTEQPAVDAEDPKGINYDRLEAAHRQRRSGNCAAAMAVYESLLGQPDLDVLQRAQAEAGLGLCKEVTADAGGGASPHFSAARSQDPAIDSWIKRERTRTLGTSEKSKRPPKKKSAKSSSPIQATEDAL